MAKIDAYFIPRPTQPFAGLLPDSKVIQRVEIAESPVKRAFRGACPRQFYHNPHLGPGIY